MADKPPSWLCTLGKKYWRQLVCKVVDDQEQLALLCDSWATYRQATETLHRDGLITTSTTGTVKPHPCVAIKNTSLTQIRSLTKSLGLMSNEQELDELDSFLGGE